MLPSKHLCILVPAPFWHLICIHFLQLLLMVLFGTNSVRNISTKATKSTIFNPDCHFLMQRRCRFHAHLYSWNAYSNLKKIIIRHRFQAITFTLLFYKWLLLKGIFENKINMVKERKAYEEQLLKTRNAIW